MVISEVLKKSIRTIPNHPRKGIMFRDITTLLNDPNAFQIAIDEIANHFKTKKIDKIISIESRGFILGGALAYILHVGFVPARKPGKLPATTLRETYKLEYGMDALEIHVDALQKGENILLVDDLLATGGTMKAACNLVRKLGCNIVGIAFLIELGYLDGRKKLPDLDVFSLVQYDSE
jgi:adenine phosphoribosyltransferase